MPLYTTRKQQTMKKVFKKEVLIAVCVLSALAILVFGIDFLKGVNVFKATNYYYATYTDVQGLAISAPVTLSGYKVGQVRDITYEYDNPGHVRVEISLDKDLRLPKGSQAVLSSDLLGTASIQLALAPGKDFYDVGAEIPGIVPKGMMDNISDNLLPSVAAIVPKVDTLLTSINALVGDPAIAASVNRLDAITSNIEKATTTLNSILHTLPPITADVKAITGNVTTVSEDLAVLSGRLRTVPVDSLMTTLSTTVQNLKTLTEQLNSPNSTLGQLMNNPSLYNNLNATVQSLDSLFTDIKAHPKRYISIKLL